MGLINRISFFKMIAAVAALSAAGNTSLQAQLYEVPFGIKGNVVQLEIVNTGAVGSPEFRVQAGLVPAWIHLQRREIRLDSLPSGGSETITFVFDAGEEALPGQVDTLRFDVFEADTRISSHQYLLRSDAPSEFTLHQNYPNPFNPSTTLSYLLPEAMRVRLQIFNILGQLVATLVNEDQPAGARKVQWDAGRQASGVYLYRLSGIGKSGKKYTASGKMLLIK